MRCTRDTSSPSLVRYYLFGTEQEIRDYYSHILENYPLEGYGTWMSEIKPNPANKTELTAFVSRFTSCD
jgi:hypothetical protein